MSFWLAPGMSSFIRRVMVGRRNAAFRERERERERECVRERREEAHCFPGPSLGTGHEVSATHNDGDRVLLHWSGSHILTPLNILTSRL